MLTAQAHVVDLLVAKLAAVAAVELQHWVVVCTVRVATVSVCMCVQCIHVTTTECWLVTRPQPGYAPNQGPILRLWGSTAGEPQHTKGLRREQKPPPSPDQRTTQQPPSLLHRFGQTVVTSSRAHLVLRPA